MLLLLLLGLESREINLTLVLYLRFPTVYVYLGKTLQQSSVLKSSVLVSRRGMLKKHRTTASKKGTDLIWTRGYYVTLFWLVRLPKCK